MAADDLFVNFSDEEKREFGGWNLASLEIEQKRRASQQQLTDEELRARLAEVNPDDELPAASIASYRRLEHLSAAELDRLIEIQKLYLSSSPYASGRIEIYKNIAQLAPWDETSRLKIVAEYEELDEPLNTCDWLAQAAEANPDNEETRLKLERMSAQTAGLRKRVRFFKIAKYVCATAAILSVAWCSGYRVTWDEDKVRAAAKAIIDPDIPTDVKPYSLLRHLYTDYSRVKYTNFGGSYLIAVTSRLRPLRHLSFPASESTGAEPSKTNTSRFTIRGEEAEFIYEKYNRHEKVLGYYQGEKYPVALRARFEGADRDTYAVGGPPEWIEKFRPE